MRARGLKHFRLKMLLSFAVVAPHAGAWVETIKTRKFSYFNGVAPHAGAWVETESIRIADKLWSVAPHAGAWVETYRYFVCEEFGKSRAPCGRVG